MSDGIFDWSPRRFFWVWATFGPAFAGGDGIENDLYFVKGICPHPLPGPLAEQYQLMGYMATEFDPAFQFSHWDGQGYRRTARFTKPVGQPARKSRRQVDMVELAHG